MEWPLTRVGKKRQGERKPHFWPWDSSTPGCISTLFQLWEVLHTPSAPRGFGSCWCRHHLLRGQHCAWGLDKHAAPVLQLVPFTSGPHPDSLQHGDLERKPGGELDACHVWHSGVFEKSALQQEKNKGKPPLFEKLKHPCVPGTVLGASQMYEGHLVCSPWQRHLTLDIICPWMSTPRVRG